MRLVSRRPRFALISVVGVVFWFHGTAIAATERILLVGDSWVAQAWQARAFETALANKALSQFSEKGDVTAIGGTTAAEWASASFLALITQELQNQPSLDIVHLSVGGNDFFQSNAQTPAELLALLNQILTDTQTIVDHILALRPQARIGYAVYDYVNTGSGFSTELGILAQAILQRANQTPNFFLINNLGVLHHAFGFPGQFGPGETPLPGGFPDYTPLLGGNPAFPGSPAAFDDSIHPTDASYVRLAEHAIDAFYADWLLPTSTPVPMANGWARMGFAAALLVAGFVMVSRYRVRRVE